MDKDSMTIEEIMEKVYCPNDFKCLKHGVSKLCKSDDKCLKCIWETAEDCPHVSMVNGIATCECPLRKYLAQRLCK